MSELPTAGHDHGYSAALGRAYDLVIPHRSPGLDDGGNSGFGSVLASDAFFPFADSIELAAEAGVTAVIQPGGSVRDNEVVSAADRSGIAMVMTGRRQFRH